MKKKVIDIDSLNKNTNIIFTQSYGRLFYQNFVDIIIQAYHENYGENITKAVLYAKSKSDFNSINEFLRILLYKYFYHSNFPKSMFFRIWS